MKQKILNFLKEININLELINKSNEEVVYSLCLRIEEVLPTVRRDLEDEESIFLEDLIIDTFPELE